MKPIWNTLEERSRAWNALSRQGLADAIWADYVSFRFGRTGDPRALEYLYPYLNHADKGTRLQAMSVAARVFEGRGPDAIADLDYFTRNPLPFLRDRAVRVAAATVYGFPADVVLEVLAPWLNHRSQFIRKLALVELGKACERQASETVLTEIRRVAETSGPTESDVRMAMARVFSGQPSEDVYRALLKTDYGGPAEHEVALTILVRGAPDEWYDRACREIFEPLLHADVQPWWSFLQRDGAVALCTASPGRGMAALQRMLHLCGNRCAGHCLMHTAPECFAGADHEANRTPLIELAESGDVPTQRVAAVCLGRLVMGAEDDEAIQVLRQLCDAGSLAVQAAALRGLGMAARSTCDEELRRLCLQRSEVAETATAAVRALGSVFLGSGHSGVFDDIRATAEAHRARPARSRKYSRPLAACYAAVGLLYLGTGASDPVEFLLDVLALPRGSQRNREYQWRAARALTMMEFPESKLGWSYISAA